ncbi:MAG: hypothetical protein CME62_12830 [Halobacteriovoraceae bacterium]|nr:hypothetical protein [Halobacteriovoraceae bacterium]|tara:strand:+ start:13242 stop:14756 length:1515 start_codon:yes stop_codon:yes gene_type:complete
MKLDTVLLLFAFILAFLTGSITYQIRTDEEVDINDIKELNEINRDLQLNYNPILRLDLNNDYPTPSSLNLLREQTPITDKNLILNPRPTDCLKNKFNQMQSDFLDKETLWTSFLCKQILLLPRDFFSISPYIHPSGKSYAFMYYNLLPSSSKKQVWYKRNARFMHIEELKAIGWPLSENAQFLNSISQDKIDRILENEKVILTEDFYLLRTGNLKYFVLNADKAANYFSRAGYNLTLKTDNCFIKIGNVCWEKKPHNLISFLGQSSIILFAVTIFIFLLTANALYQRIKLKKMEEERKKHALRVLTHELRTPVASLLLQIEELTRETTQLPNETVENIYKIENEIYRLKRLAEKSKSYLQTQGDSDMQFHKNEIKVKEYLQEIIDEYPQVEIQLSVDRDFSITTDPYWLKMCITNLIENAIRYGSAPIKIEAAQDSEYCFFKITDQGTIQYQSLKEIARSKHENSKGLGLGLKIIQKTLKFLDGELHFSPNPTTFTIRFKRTVV